MRWVERWWLVEGFMACARKGFMAVVLHLPVDKRPWMENNFGLDDDRLHGIRQMMNGGREWNAYDDIWRDQLALPKGDEAHHRTDLIVEWTRLHAQRAAKVFCLVGALLGIAGLVVGLTLGSILL